MRHLVVTRFAVPRPEAGTAGTYRDERWLERRLELFRRFFAPSVAPLGIDAVLLCGREAALFVARRVEDLAWARVEVQEEWRGGWRGEPDQVLTRLDSDDAVHPGWFEAVERAPAAAKVLITKEFLRWDLRAGRLHRYRRSEPAPLAAFRGGENPYRVDHRHLESLDGVHRIRGPLLLQVVHEGNVANHRPRPWRIDRWASKRWLHDFGVSELSAR